MCVIEETFHLHPPSWVTETPRPESTALFRTYVKNAPKLWAEDTSTYQGFYLMSPTGGYLGGNFGIVREEQATELMTAALEKWKASGAAMRPVPSNALTLFGGKEPQAGALKLELAYRDLPRGEVERPTTAYIQNPYNLGWFDFSAEEAQTFLTDSQEPQAIPQEVFRKLATHTLKDAVRGQKAAWKDDALQAGHLTTQRISNEGSRTTYRLSGSAKLADDQGRYEAQLHGRAVYDSARKAFVAFELVSAGQRSGKGSANGRENDPGPAPMGVAFRLYPLQD